MNEVQAVKVLRVEDGDDIFRDDDFGLEKSPREFFSRVPLEDLRLKMGSMVLLLFSHPVLFVYTNRANPVRDCRLINQIPKLCRVFLTSRDKLIRQLFRSVFSLRKIGI
jgi:hypothetical protein